MLPKHYIEIFDIFCAVLPQKQMADIKMEVCTYT